MKKIGLVLMTCSALAIAAGCSMIKKGGGTGKAVVTLSSRADSLNWDEQGGVHSVEVRAFVLKTPDRFMQGSIADLFELKQQKTFWASFADDTLALAKITLDPGAKKVVSLTYDKSKAGSNVYLAVIGNFNQPPEGSKERRYVKMGASGGKAAFYVPKNTIEQPKK